MLSRGKAAYRTRSDECADVREDQRTRHQAQCEEAELLVGGAEQAAKSHEGLDDAEVIHEGHH